MPLPSEAIQPAEDYQAKVRAQLGLQISQMRERSPSQSAVQNSAIRLFGFWEPQENDYEEFVLETHTPEFRQIQRRTVQSLWLSHRDPKSVQIVEIRRVQNISLFEKYQFEIQRLQDLGRPVNRQQFYHGTKSQNPSTICQDKDVGLNPAYSGESVITFDKAHVHANTRKLSPPILPPSERLI